MKKPKPNPKTLKFKKKKKNIKPNKDTRTINLNIKPKFVSSIVIFPSYKHSKVLTDTIYSSTYHMTHHIIIYYRNKSKTL